MCSSHLRPPWSSFTRGFPNAKSHVIAVVFILNNPPLKRASPLAVRGFVRRLTFRTKVLYGIMKNRGPRAGVLLIRRLGPLPNRVMLVRLHPLLKLLKVLLVLVVLLPRRLLNCTLNHLHPQPPSCASRLP